MNKKDKRGWTGQKPPARPLLPPSVPSSLLSPFLVANCLIRRPVKAPAAKAGDLVEIMLLK